MRALPIRGLALTLCAVAGKVQAMKDVAAEAEEDRLFEEDRGGSESLGAALARNKLLRQKQVRLKSAHQNCR